MRSKEIFIKKLSFVICITLIICFVVGAEVPLPLRSEIRLNQQWGCFVPYFNHLIITQKGDEIRILIYEPRNIKEGFISVSEFEIFWDSLHSLNYWQLKKKYHGVSESYLPIKGFLSVSLEKLQNVDETKKIEFINPNFCSEEFSSVYKLIKGMERYTIILDWKILLKYAEMGIEEEILYNEINTKLNYNKAAEFAIYFIEDNNDLDTLLLLLPQKRKFAGAIINAIKNIGDKKAIPVLIKILEEEMNEKEFNDERISLIIQALLKLTGQNFPYNESDSLAAKKETINKWINWWKENKDKFK